MITDAISQTTNTQTTATRQSEQDATTAAADFESFLQLLTAQMRNQDPLSPIDSTQFVEQLASFSSVEQQIQTNSQLEDLVASLTASDLSSASEWIGRHVEVESSSSRYVGEPLNYRVPESTEGTPFEAIVYNSGGEAIYRERIPAGQFEFSWNGANDSGNPVPFGNYSVEITYSYNGELVDAKTPRTVAAVTEARIVDSSARLILADGTAIDPADVRAVHMAPEASADSAEDETKPV